MRIYLACFDIEDDRQRRKLGDLLLEYGDRVQHSVFEIALPDQMPLDTLRQRCLRYVGEQDSLRFYWLNDLSRSQSVDAWGQGIARYPQGVVL
ncbi:CRISPR-associated endonuclease Cas2 [Pokkaliibacter sp. MBI-7]|uniref:CRISPR-associated endonuclease Cas2 n=1 Tax=Pokkaliibacter sp. MBI-7 TaxID=3040600 RepID=UPI002448F864|nr:CRISPR-associated endonuclease Cas2 [Pokkaliibacter sp. MBI-7]MDH2431447.1 CRISPR-associated endonuclease Cas2 [Pokkaliibacter sp. MBI-7]